MIILVKNMLKLIGKLKLQLNSDHNQRVTISGVQQNLRKWAKSTDSENSGNTTRSALLKAFLQELHLELSV